MVRSSSVVSPLALLLLTKADHAVNETINTACRVEVYPIVIMINSELFVSVKFFFFFFGGGAYLRKKYSWTLILLYYGFLRVFASRPRKA
jgi:hypothetical protein